VQPIISIAGLSKTYASGFRALKSIDLEIRRGEIFALLGPNGAGKTTLINIVCGIVNPSGGRVTVDGHDIVGDYRAARSQIGLVHPSYVEKVLKDLSLWDKKDSKIMTLSGGMKRRVLIAKALAHEPQILFLDEPTAGVDVELRKDMWQVVRDLRASGVTIILTTHYIEEAEQMAERVGVINGGELILVEDKATLMRKLGKKELKIQLQKPLDAVPAELAAYRLMLAADGTELIYAFDTKAERPRITALLEELIRQGIRFKDINTTQSSLEDIFVDLVRQGP
jgi:ABC-2 type transport system ATP-binding protein